MILGNVTECLECHGRLNELDGLHFVEIQQADGTLFAAADTMGAKPGQRVMVCQGEAAQCLLGRRCPLDAAVVAVLSVPHR